MRIHLYFEFKSFRATLQVTIFPKLCEFTCKTIFDFAQKNLPHPFYGSLPLIDYTHGTVKIFMSGLKLLSLNISACNGSIGYEDTWADELKGAPRVVILVIIKIQFIE